MAGFLSSQWRDIAGNVKFWVLTVILGGLLTGFTILTHGLKWWQQAGVVALYSVMFVWALTTTLMLRRRPNEAIAPATQAPTSGTPPESQDVDAFYRTYDNAMLVEAETNIRQQSNRYQAGADRERFLIRLFASGVIIFVFEQTWAYIFRSQIRALEELNRHPLAISAIRRFYDEAAAQAPLAYENYPFENWLNFMRTHFLFGQQGEMLAITIRGKEFLKYLVQMGRSANDKNL